MLEPDRGEVERFVGALFRRAYRGFVLTRAFSGDSPWGVGHWRAVAAHDAQAVVSAAVDFAARCAKAHPEPVVFSPPIATFRDSSSAAEANVSLGLVLSVECDEWPALAREVLTEIIGPATLELASGSTWPNPETNEREPRLHLHWRLCDPTQTAAEHSTLREARRLAARLAGRVGSDRSAVPICHPLRWAGSWNTKGAPRLARIVGGDPEREVEAAHLFAILRRAVAGLPGGDAVISAGERESGELLAPSIEDVAHALWVIPNDDLSWHDWNRVGMATFAATGGSDQGLCLFALWSAKSPKDVPDVTRARWAHLHTAPPSRIGFGSLSFLARPHSDGPPDWVRLAMEALG